MEGAELWNYPKWIQSNKSQEVLRHSIKKDVFDRGIVEQGQLKRQSVANRMATVSIPSIVVLTSFLWPVKNEYLDWFLNLKWNHLGIS